MYRKRHKRREKEEKKNNGGNNEQQYKYEFCKIDNNCCGFKKDKNGFGCCGW
ncbi:MAG: hypothetical protein IJT15_02160 [Rickettsiales bacterium]|nr:hypothetical protein [Rickettsiales bacterium]